MRESEILSESDLDAALVGGAIAKRQRLWKAASGQAPRWTDVLMAVLGVAQVFLGAYGVISAGEPNSFVLLAFGILFVGFSLWRIQEARIDALRELLRSIESGRR
jgi:heme A synthase